MRQSSTFVIGAMLLAYAACTPAARAATEAEKVAGIHKGLAYLYNSQHSEGYWRFSGDEQAATGAAAFAFLSQQDKWGNNEAEYQVAVDKAIAYLVSTANTMTVSTRKDGVNVCFGGTGSCRGVYWFGNAKSTFATGLVAPAIAAYGIRVGSAAVATTSGPLAGMTWNEIAQAITNALAASQLTSGGWGSYIPGNGDSDSSNTQWAVMALIYNETLGAITPSSAKSNLEGWLGNIQQSSGAVCSQPGSEQCDHAETGGGLLAMKFVGYNLTNVQVLRSLSFLNRYWQSATDNVAYGNFGHPYAMWAVYKGLEASIGLNDTTHINNLLTDCGATTRQARRESSGTIPCTWSEDYSHWLVKNQKVDGSWGGYSYWTDPLAAAFYVNILGATHMPFKADQPAKSSTDERTQVSQQRPTVAAAAADTRSAGLPIASAQAAQPAITSPKLRPRGRKGVTAVAVTSDGNSVASASTDNSIRIWSTTTGQQSVVLPGSLGLPSALVFTGGGGTLSSGGRDSVVRLWDAVSGREIGELAAHEHAVSALAASPDDRFLASSGEETRIMLWDQTSRKLNKILFGPTDFVNAISFSPDSRLLASAGEDARVLIIDVATGKTLYTLLGHSGPIDSAVFSPDGTVLASGGQDTVIHLWDPVKGQQRRALSGHAQPIRSIAFSPDSRLIASGGEDTRIILWNVATGAMDKILSGSTGAINALSFDPKGRYLVSASDAGEITLWNVAAGIKLLTIRVPGAL